jgi:integrase
MRGSVFKRGRTWTYVLSLGRVPGTGKKRQRWVGGFKTKADAELALTRALAAQDGGVTVVTTTTVNVAQFLDEWLEAVRPSLKATTAKSYVEMMQGYVAPRIGDVLLTRLNPGHLRRLYGELLVSGRRRASGGLSTRTVVYTHRVLSHALSDAVRWGMLTANPAEKVDPPRVVTPEMRVWTAEEARRFLALVQDDRLYALWAVFLAIGLRRGEVAGLRWDDVDLERREAAVRRTRVVVGWQVHVSEPKTRSSRRTVSLDPTTVAVLRAHRSRQLEERLAWGPTWQDSRHVFCSEDGQPVHPQRITKAFDRMVAVHGLPKIRLHDLRHTSASLALLAGVHPKVVSERMGHANVGITLDTYSHVVKGMQEEAAVKVAELLFG